MMNTIVIFVFCSLALRLSEQETTGDILSLFAEVKELRKTAERQRRQKENEDLKEIVGKVQRMKKQVSIYNN